jgi:hypothetical protein
LTVCPGSVHNSILPGCAIFARNKADTPRQFRSGRCPLGVSMQARPGALSAPVLTRRSSERIIPWMRAAF